MRNSLKESSESFSRSTYFVRNYFSTNRKDAMNLLKEVNIMAVDLTDNEKAVLKNALEYYLGLLREEIVKTEVSTMKPQLHAEEDTIKKLIEKFS
jgi:hypothetical protein